jgi:hypothetical protein
MNEAFGHQPRSDQALQLPAPLLGWWSPLFGTLQAMCWRAVGGL